MKFAKSLLIVAISAVILCSTALSRKAKRSKANNVFEDCQKLCTGTFEKVHIYKLNAYGKDGMNKKIICKCKGAILDNYFSKDFSWPDSEFKAVDKSEAKKYLPVHFHEIDQEGKKIARRRMK